MFQSLGELGDALGARRDAGLPFQVVDAGVPLTDATARAAGVWDSQPSVRKVVDFIASNIASIPFHVYERAGDTDRRRVTEGPLAQVVATPRPGVTPYRFWYTLIVDSLLHDRWAALKVTDGNTVTLQRIPPRRFRIISDGLDRVIKIRVITDKGTFEDLDPARFIFDAGYADVGAGGTSPMRTIQHLLDESSEAVAWRRAVWKNGVRAPAVVYRDKPWPSQEARDRFGVGLANFTRSGGLDGGWPLLEDGMKIEKLDVFNPKDAQDLEGRRLTDIEVASSYHIAPELVGAREGTYSNVDAFRQMLYRDSLGPYITAFEQAINVSLVPDMDGEGLYVEAHVEAKLRGSFIEQAQSASTATGRPWMTTNEQRARFNMPAIDGGDDLVTPLNVLVGGQASPRDSGTQNRPGRSSARPLIKSALSDSYHDQAQRVVKTFFARQERVVRSALGVKADGDWWDGDRWDEELSDDLLKLFELASSTVGKKTAEDLGYNADDYDVDATIAFLRAVAARMSGSINAATKSQIDDALASDQMAEGLDSAFEVAKEQRSGSVAAGVLASAAGFAAIEAAKQVGRQDATKTWITGPNARQSHAAMNGETVPIDEPFSNGANWPADASLGADEVAGCNCSVQIDTPN